MVAKASEVAEGELFAFAGIWDRWRDQSGKVVETCSILTTIQTLSPLPSTTACQHPDSYDLWLDPGMKDVSAASELLKPYDSRPMRCYPVSSRSAALRLHAPHSPSVPFTQRRSERRML
jgi:putative SOS response-associated peptidase YedK